jgi:hypothetical protein
MLDIFENEMFNKYANRYFLMFFNLIDDDIEHHGHKSVLWKYFLFI